MDTGAMYRNGTPVALGIGDTFSGSNPIQVTPSNFYPREPLLPSPALQQNRGQAGDPNITVKLDQLMNMVSSTQQMIMNQEKNVPISSQRS